MKRRNRAAIGWMECLEGRWMLSGSASAVPAITQTNLVSDGAIPAAHVDANVVNAWGLAISPAGGVWVANNGSGTATVYDQNGTSQGLVVSIPGPGGAGAGTPTGQVFHRGRGFNVSSGGRSAASTFLFDTEDGTILGWSAAVDPTHAVIAVDHSAAGDVFKGLATVGNRLYATDFHHGTVEVFDQNFKPVTLKAGAFSDSSIPAGFAPFGIQAVGSQVYVTYAKQDAAAHDDVSGIGNGYVDVFNSSGKFIRHVASAGNLNSPWGVAIAPSKWGKYKNDVLIGNFGDGKINVFDKKGNALGQLADANSAAIDIPGLWSLQPGVGSLKQELFFTAGPNDESNGLFGSLAASLTAGSSVGTSPQDAGASSGTSSTPPTVTPTTPSTPSTPSTPVGGPPGYVYG